MDEARLDQLKTLIKEAVSFLEKYASLEPDNVDDIDDLIQELESALRSLR
jgi:DNA-directed RNA polymerase subunit F